MDHPFAQVWVSDLMKMSVEELRKMAVFGVKDPENMTEEHFEKLRLLVNGRDASRRLDLEAVNDKLRNLTEASPTSSRVRCSLSPTTPDFDDPVRQEEDRLESLRQEHQAYRDLLRDGGRPSHIPDVLGFEYLYEPHTGIIQYWIIDSSAREFMFQQQKWRWEQFREHQNWRRWRYWKPEWFERFVQEVRAYRQEKGLEGDIHLSQDREKQSKLQDWAEFQYWHYQKADQLARQIVHYAKKVEGQETRLQAAIDAGRPAQEIDWIRDFTLASMKGRRGGLERDLESQKVLLKWIDEQLPIIASECQTRSLDMHASTDTSLGKRKRLTSEPGHAKDSRHRAKSAEPSVGTAEVRHSRLARELKSEPPTPPNARHKHRTKACSEISAAGDTIPALATSSPLPRNSSSESTKSSRRGHLRSISVPAQRGRQSDRAGSNTITSGLCQHSAAIPTADATFQRPNAELAPLRRVVRLQSRRSGSSAYFNIA